MISASTHLRAVLLNILFYVACVSAQSLVFPPYLHSYGIRKATPAHLFMFFGPRTFFDDPQGLATAKMVSRDDPSTEGDDDEVVVYGVNSGRHQLIYNTSMWTLDLYGSHGDGRDQFSSPKGIACDPHGNVYVVDSGNNRIVHLFNPKRTVQWVKAFGATGENRLRAPSQVALDEWGRVYVTDTGNRRIVVFDTTGKVVHTIGGGGDGIAFVDGPAALALADGANYWTYAAFRRERVVFCADSGGRRVWKIGLNGKAQKTMVLPEGHRAGYAAIDYYHNLWITDKTRHCVVKFDHNLEYLDTFGSLGKQDNQFVEPRGIAIWKRYGQTFVAEKTGAQYYWIGTDLKECALRTGRDAGQLLLDTRLTEYSYVSLFRTAGVDTVFYLKKRMVYPGRRTTSVGVRDGAGRDFVLRVEPTYSSYTYFWTDRPLNIKR